jgi:homoserine dehydrogenase
VVTANKALLARQGVELEACSRQRSAPLRFEAAVAGGVPLLAPLARDLAANRWSQLAGIVNGTTNHILTAMTEEGRAYPEVLADAQARGYAEADPSGDVEGRDAADKLTLLCRLAFGAWIDVDRIPRAAPGSSEPGITGVTAAEIAEAAGQGLVLKLIAAASRTDGRLAASVRPTAVAAGSPLGSTGGVTNMVVLRGEPIGEVRFAGPGAGGAATSSAVLGDLLAIARGEGSTWAALPPAGTMELAPALEPPALGAEDRPGAIDRRGAVERPGAMLGRYPILEPPA